MSRVLVKFDNKLKYEDIIVQLHNSSVEESGENYKNNQQEIQQTLIYGIQAPLIKINNVIIDFVDVIEFSLKSIDTLPSVSMTVKDRYNLTASFDIPGNDNAVHIQILPPFDNAYKKINLTFYISQIKINTQGYINLVGIYKLQKLTSSNIKSFGETNTYNLFSNIATETGLGFATNVDMNDSDKRYIYCDNKSYLDIMNREIKYSGADMQIMDYWVDYWNNLTLVDIYERYNTIEKDENMMVWISGEIKEIGEGQKITPIQSAGVLTNNPILSSSDLFVTNYNIINKAGNQFYRGTDKVYSIYGENNKEYLDYLIQDGDVKKDIFIKCEYLGEYYGDVNYLLMERKRYDFLQKINTESIEVELRMPLLAIKRGNKINLLIYKNDTMIENQKEGLIETNTINKNIQTHIPIEDSNIEEKSNDGQYVLDKNLSGQYLITGCNMKYYNNQWHYLVTLNRPSSNKSQILNE